MKLVLLLFAVFVLLASANPGRGFGDDYNWFSLEEGQEEAKRSGKPVMYVIHKSWCGACKRLGPQFAESKEILNLSRRFVMINIQDDEEPKDPKFAPDGGYIPRILFGKPDGDIMTDINTGQDQYKYFFSNPEGIVKAMEIAFARV